MASDKAPYQLTIKIDSSRADAVSEAITQIREIAGEYDQRAETSASLKFECYKEAPLTAILESFEVWLYHYKIALECDVSIKRPGVRPETALRLRTRGTPMDQAGWDNEAEP